MKRTICDIRELPSLAALKAWARHKHVAIEYLGRSLRDEPVYGARCGVVTRVARGNHLNRKGCRP